MVAEMENALSTEDLHASVLHQVISTENTNASTFAKENHISLGKAVFVLNLAKKDSSLSAKELAKMRISDIAKLVAEKKIVIRDIIEYDNDAGVYEIDFKLGGVEYDYEIAASNGAVRKADAERDD